MGQVSGDASAITFISTKRKTKEAKLKVFDWNGELLRNFDMERGMNYCSVAMVAKLKGGFASSENGRVVLLHANGEHIIELPSEVGGYKWLSSADGNVLVANDTRAVHTWRLEAPDDVRTISAPKVSDTKLSEGGSQLAGNVDDDVRVWSSADGSPLTAWKSAGLDLFSSSISRDGTRIAAGAGDGTIVVADSGVELHRFENEMIPSSLGFSSHVDRTITRLVCESTVSGGELISPRRSGGSGIICQSKNRVSPTPGYAIGWSLENEAKVGPVGVTARDRSN